MYIYIYICYCCYCHLLEVLGLPFPVIVDLRALLLAQLEAVEVLTDDELGTPDPQLEPQITSLEKREIHETGSETPAY